jgi:hypothetical protein
MAQLRSAVDKLSNRSLGASGGASSGDRASAGFIDSGNLSPRLSPRTTLTGFLQRRAAGTPRRESLTSSPPFRRSSGSQSFENDDEPPSGALPSVTAMSSSPTTPSVVSSASAQAPLSPRRAYASHKLVDAENDSEFYAKNFLDREHTNLYSRRGDIISLGAVTSDGQYYVKVWSATGFVHLALPAQLVKRGALRIKPTIKARLQPVQHIVPALDIDELKLLRSAAAIDLAMLELSQVVKHYKFGVLLMRDGQALEEDMYSNEAPRDAPAYGMFLAMLGDRVELKGHKGYRAGLDVKSDSTGTHSVYTTFRDFEIMFHVATLLPFDPLNPQQLHRKRHIGNDIVVVVFNVGTTPFDPSCIRSNFNHVFIVVQCDANSSPMRFKVATAAKAPMPKFGPSLPPQGVFVGQASGLREWLLTKLVNAERAAYHAPAFKGKINSTRRALLQEVIDKHK